ncbi:MAG: 4Fe-4S ferredoxin [Thermodesulfobacteriota bacterium]
MRSGICPNSAFFRDELAWPRILRAEFSDPTIPHKKTAIAGRGTAEMKTNDVTGRIKRGEVGVAVELGRPGIGTRFSEVEKIIKEVTRLQITLEEANPISSLINNREEGTLFPEILKEKVLSAIVEFKVPFARAEEILQLLAKIADQIETVASISFIGRSDADGSFPLEKFLIEKRIEFYPNGKVNLGLGRPLIDL